MVDLPIPDVSPVTSSFEPTAAHGIFKIQPKVGLEKGIQAIAEGVDAIATKAGKMAGEEDALAVQRNADGSLEPINNFASHFIMGNAGEAYQHSYTVSSLAALQTNIDEKANEIRNEHPNDPQGFRLAMGQYADKVRGQFGGPLGVAGFKHATQLGSQYYIGLVNEKKDRDMNTAYEDITTRIGNLRTEVGNLARGTQSDKTDFIEKLPQWQQLQSYYQSLGDNPNFKHVWSKEKIDSTLSQFKQEAVDHWAIGNAQRIRDRDGVDAAVKWSETNVLNANTTLPYEKRVAAHHMVLAQIQTLTEQQKADISANQIGVKAMGELFQRGTPPSEEQYQQMLDKTRTLRDINGAQQLQAWHDGYHQILKPYTSLPPQAGVSAVMGSGQPGIVSHINEADAAMKLTPQERSLYTTHFRNLTGPGGVDNEDGSRSTLFATTVNIEGKEYVLPTVYDGKKVPVREAVERAKKIGLENFPSYANNKEAQARYDKLHSFMEKDTEAYLSHKNAGPAVMGDRPAPTGDVMTRAKAGIATIESGSVQGNYGALGQVQPNGDRAYGKYQVMGANIPSWTRRWFGRELTPQEFLSNHDAQEKVFEGAFGDMLKKHSPADAASIWFSGRPLSMARGSKDSTGTTVPAYVAKFSRVFGSDAGAGGVAGPSSPIPFTPEQIAKNPFLISAAVQMHAGDSARQVAFAKDQAEVMSKAIAIGAAPDVQSLAQVAQIAAAHPDQLGETWTKLKAQVDAQPIAMQAAGYPDGGRALIAEAEDQARRSPDLYMLTRAEAAKNMAAGFVKAFHDDPHGYAARVGWIKKEDQPPPFEVMARPDLVGASTPAEALGVALAQRREAGVRIAPALGVTPAEAMFPKNDAASLGSILKRVDGDTAGAILKTLDGSLRPEELQALSAHDEFSNAVASLTRSGDPAKVGAAFGFLDKQWRQNPEAFKKEFGGDMENKMAVWNDAISTMTPDAAARRLTQWTDPNAARAADALRTQADADLKNVGPEKVLGSFGGFWKPGAPVSFEAGAATAGMMQDYRAAYRSLFAESGDKAIAEKRALERVQMKWGPSEVNGGRVMAYPPERYYLPDINGKRDYIQSQLSEAISGIDPKYAAADRVLVADDRTQEDIANRLPPSYRVAIKDDAGRWLPLESRPGSALRFRADREAIFTAQNEKMMLQRQQSFDNLRSGAM